MGWGAPRRSPEKYKPRGTEEQARDARDWQAGHVTSRSGTNGTGCHVFPHLHSQPPELLSDDEHGPLNTTMASKKACVGPVNHLRVKGGGNIKPIGRTPILSGFLAGHLMNSGFNSPRNSSNHTGGRKNASRFAGGGFRRKNMRQSNRLGIFRAVG